MTFSDLDADAQRVVLQIDGQTLDDKHLKQAADVAGRPAPGHATSAFESRYFDPTKAYGGPWAWFRHDRRRRGSVAPDAQQRIVLNIQNRYHRRPGDRRTRARGTPNPFATGAWRQFSCES